MLLLALVATGCVSGVTTQKIPVNIGFRPVIGHDTRAYESIPFPQDRTFSVWALDRTSGDLYIEDETIVCRNGLWNSAMVWPENELHFFAFHPQDIPHEFDLERGIVINDYSTADGGKDILMASAVADDYVTDSLVNLSFDHILSRVEFRVAKSLSSDITVVVQKIVLDGFSLSGSYNNRDYQAWNKTSEDDVYVIFEDEEGVEITNDPIYIGDDFYTIPQLCKAEVIITYKIRYGQSGWVTDQIETTGNLRTEWNPGKQYTYTLMLTDTKLTYTTGISNWNNRE